MKHPPGSNPRDRSRAGAQRGNPGWNCRQDRVFVWRQGKRLKAYSANWPHLGGPLDKGILAGGTIRCPWHHACFLLTLPPARRPTAAPAFDALLEYPVTLDTSCFSVKTPNGQTRRPVRQRDPSSETMAIVGGGAAGFAAADALRKRGWRGEIAVFSDEAEQPYDRATLLTRTISRAAFGDDRLPIARHSLADLGVDFEAESVQHIDPENKRLRLENGNERPYAKLLLATSPRSTTTGGSGRKPSACDGVALPSGLPTRSR